ncbi:hypothetical protein F4820DRAFT_390777 [Hypoxylon rubiginosum]|uniref:Uncharacterized protein n=1 Tax=Hypoxylon rubiginosum TaxID=110542 RepID=A0ACB9YUL6_9PEZI|nr:hypothetical protein F4820DRAFT_390777 [Hypoxylon rubiginosum]
MASDLYPFTYHTLPFTDADVDSKLAEPTISHSVDPRQTSLSHELVIFHNLESISADMSRRRVPITFTYQKNGTYPPIYVAGSFSDPPWQPQEMDVSIDQHGGHLFTKTVMVDDGSEIQYKFRIGLGNWWALDDSADKVTDNWGNVNNVLRVSINKSQEADTKSPTPQITELKETAPSTDAQTRDVAKVAAEVADSAYAIDLEAPEPEISDAEAGRTGIRRMTHTPISEVAQTAMEVSIVAATLGDDDSEPGDEFDDDESIACPMFSHEFIGSPHQGEETSDRLASKTVSQDGDRSPVLETEDVDFNDPQLERLPSSDRSSIIAAMRRISSSVEVDRTVIEGVPLSAVIPLFRQNRAASPPEESRGYSESTGATPREESIHRPTIITNRSDSAYSRTSEASLSSLGSIAEGDELPNDNVSEELDDPEVTPPFIQHPGPSWGSLFEHAVSSDSDDEGIAMRAESKRVLELHDRPPFLTSSPFAPSSSGPAEIADLSPMESAPVAAEASTAADSKDEPTLEEGASKDSPSSTAYRLPGTYESDSSNKDSIDEGETQPTSIDSNSQADLKRRAADRTAALSPSHLFQDPNKHPGWLKTCFQVVLVKWLGGFAAWIYGRRHGT